MEIKLNSYPEMQRLRLSNDDSLVVFSSYPTLDTFYPEIAGREIFRVGIDGSIIWQINPQKGETDTLSGNFIIDIDSKSSFVYLRREASEYFALRFNGDSFLLDQYTGVARFHHWEKS